MSGIAGIADSGMNEVVNQMLDRIDHRGPDGRKIIDVDGSTIGAVWTKTQENQGVVFEPQYSVMDCVAGGHIAYAQIINGNLELTRDQLGVAPLYYGWDESGALCFASEVKALLGLTNDVYEISPGHRFDGKDMKPYYQLEMKQPINKAPDQIAKELQQRLSSSVEKFVEELDTVGSWLSGGLDSSTMASLARPNVRKLHTFAAGFIDAPDLEYARLVAEYIQSDHHEIILNFDDVLSVLPEVIYYLESFDALLVRSSITNYMVAKTASRYVSNVLSGEGGDELFAGYSYLKSLDPATLSNELIEITGRLHNTALQRVDRSASAHGTKAHVGFLDPNVVNYAISIPTKFKLLDGIEKWILRKAMNKVLPKSILNRTKAKFWKGAGINDLLEKYAEEQIDNKEFGRERILPNGWILNSKEELLYYRIFRKHFRDLRNLSWMGRTKGAPKI